MIMPRHSAHLIIIIITYSLHFSKFQPVTVKERWCWRRDDGYLAAIPRENIFFLINHLQQAGLKGSTSKTFSVSSDVPQGSVIGPLLFLVYMYVNDIPGHVGCSISMSANDTKIYATILEVADSYRLQVDLNSLVKWACGWLLRFNVNKCKYMSIGSKPITSYSITDESNINCSLSTSY